MTPVREEIFGPVVVVVPFDDEDEAIAIANDSDFGLYSYVFSGDTGRAWDVAKRLRSGNVGINTAAAQPRGAVRRLQAVGRRPRRRQLRAARLLARSSPSSGRADARTTWASS